MTFDFARSEAWCALRGVRVLALTSVAELQTQRAGKLALAQEIIAKADKENRAMAEDEQAIFDKAMADAEALEKQIEQHRQHFERRQQLAALNDQLTQPEGRRTEPTPPGTPQTPAPQASDLPYRIPAEARRFGGARNVVAIFDPHGKERPRVAEARAYASGMFILAAFFKNERAAHWCRDNGVQIRAAQSEGTDAGGGYLVPEPLATAIIDLRENFGVFRRNVRVWPMTSDTLVVPRRNNHVTVAWTGENVAITPSDPSWQAVRLLAKKLAGLTLMPIELAEDAVMELGGWCAEDFAWALSQAEDQAGFIGDGSAQYGNVIGLVNALLAGSIKVAATGHTSFATVDLTDIVNLMALLPEYARANARWYCSSAAEAVIMGRLKTAAGGNDIAAYERGWRREFLGYPVEITQVMHSDVAVSVSKPVLIFGDLTRSSSMGNRRGVTVRISEHHKFAEDQIALKVTERLDIQNHETGTATAAGPVVLLKLAAS